MKLRILACLLTVVSTALTLGAAPADAQAGDPHFEQPVLGECHNYTRAGLDQRSDMTPAVACSTTHTAQVIKVVQLPDALDWTATDAQLLKVVDAKCAPAFTRSLGRTRLVGALTAYGWGWFAPTQVQQDAGARWLRCDAFLWGGRGLAPMRYAKTPLIRSSLPTAIRKCMQGTTLLYTTCSRSHAWRATGDFNVRKGTYPNATKMRAIALKKCPARVSSRTFRWVSPSKTQWQGNYRVMVCFTKSHS